MWTLGRSAAWEVARDLRAMDLSWRRALRAPERMGATTRLALDRAEHRYLLGGAACGGVCCWDVAAADGRADRPRQHTGVHGPVFHLARGASAAHAHTLGVSSVAWHPADSGLFVTGSWDASVKVWDANALGEAALTFQVPAKVYAASLSACARVHALVAVGCGDPTVRLADMRAGGVAHSLHGHRDAVWAAEWSPSDEYLLASGGRDGTVRLWDVRRPGNRPRGVLDKDRVARFARRRGGWAARPGSGWGGRWEGRGTLGFGFGHASGSGSSGGADWAGDDDALAHEGAVNALCFTGDGLHLVSGGGDGELRLWNVATGVNTLAHFPGAANRTGRPIQMACSEDGRTLAVPCGRRVQLFDIPSGTDVLQEDGPRGLAVRRLDCHFGSVQGLAWRPGPAGSAGELYSGGEDRCVLCWEAPGEGDLGAARVKLAREQRKQDRFDYDAARFDAHVHVHVDDAAPPWGGVRRGVGGRNDEVEREEDEEEDNDDDNDDDDDDAVHGQQPAISVTLAHRGEVASDVDDDEWVPTDSDAGGA